MTLRERLGCAALASVAFHGLVLSQVRVPPEPAPGEPLRLSARLARPEPTKPAAPQRAATARASRPAAAAPDPAPVERAPTTAPVAAHEADYAETEAAPTPAAEEEPPQQVAHAAVSTEAIARTLPRHGRITYSVFYGESRTYVGKVVQSWEVENDVYRLASQAETDGLMDLLSPRRLHYLSQGRVTRHGLRPESFLMSRTQRGRTEAAQARFDWESGTLAYGRAREPKSAPLTPGAHDFMSFIYQNALHPPAPGRYRVPITTGPRFAEYEVEVTGEEIIETPIGAMRALPIRQVPRPGSESIKIWLASEYRHLPVRIRHFDRDGNYSGEQVVNEIRISEE